MDVKYAFLNDVLNEEIYDEQYDGFEKEITTNKVYLLKDLYGLKQAPRVWYSRLDSQLLSLGFEKSVNKVTLYAKYVGKHKSIVLVYIDDLFITSDKE